MTIDEAIKYHLKEAEWNEKEAIMGGHIHICRKSGCECNCKKCKFYLSMSEADKLIIDNNI